MIHDETKPARRWGRIAFWMIMTVAIAAMIHRIEQGQLVPPPEGPRDPEPAPAAVTVQESPIIAGRPYQVGYRRQKLEFQNLKGTHVSRQLDLWYPTLEPEQKHRYKGPIGFAAENAAVAPGRWPLLIFSHGYLSVSDQTIFLMEACARSGYIVASMNHADSVANRVDRPREWPRFRNPESWTDEKYRDRGHDLVTLIDQLLKWNAEPKSDWFERIDADRIGAMGHSLGGYTVLGLAGGWHSWKDDRIKAVVLFSPFLQPLVATGNLAHVKVPVLFQGGTLDFGITPHIDPAYRKLAGPKYYLVLNKETHFGWTNLISVGKDTKECVADGNAELMLRYTLACFDQYLLGSDQSQILKTADKQLESYRFEAP